MKIKNQTKSIITVSFLVTICLIVFIAVNANRFIKSMSENNSRLYDAYRISELMKSFRSNITVLGNKEQSYMVTGDAKFLEEYKLKETETRVYLQAMEKYFVDKPEQELFFKLRELTYKKLGQAKDLSHNMPGIPQMTGDEQSEEGGVKIMGDINATIDLINTSLGKTTQGLITNSISYVQSSRNWGLMEVAAGIFAALAAIILLFRDINVRNRLEEELRIAKKRADDNAMMKEQFMANMSHEIRTPMNAILGFSDLMYKTKLDPVQDEYLSAIKHSSANLLNIINDILDFSKIEAGMLHIEKIPFSITDTVKSLKMIFEEKAREKQLPLHVSIDANVPPVVLGDPTRLAQILVNLLNNAIKFTHKGSVEMKVEIAEQKNDMISILFKVKDTGVGIPANKHAAVFERFNQANTETTRTYGGTGLGLSIVKSLVEMQQGTISFTSTEHRGTEFTVNIAYQVSHDLNRKKTISFESGLEKWKEHSRRVLVAEDNLLNQKLITSLFKGFGLDVVLVENGQEALDILKREQFDLILMDIQMPVLDGYHATLKIRQELKLQLPVIAMTAHILEGEMEKCKSYGMDDYISKPFKEADMYRLLLKYLGKEMSTASVVNEPETVSLKVSNLDDLYEMARGNKQFIIEMIEIFVEQNPSDLKELEDAIAINDHETVSAIAHRMKTSVGFIGLKQLLQPLTDMETLGEKTGEMETIKGIFKTVKHTCELAVGELNNVLQNPGLL